jgi:hypothetical protein
MDLDDDEGSWKHMVFLLYPALVLAVANFGAALPPVAPASAVTEPTFDPNAPPSWWTDKMRQPCTKSGDRVVC